MADADRLVAALRYQQEMEDASRPVTVNPLMARKAEAIKQNAPAENMLTQYAETMPQNWQQFGQNMAQAYPTPATGASREQILGAVTQAAMNAGPLMIGYHGTNLPDIETFDRLTGPARRQGMKSLNEIGHWFSATPETAKKFGPNVLKRDLQLENPMPVTNMEELRTLWQESQGRERTKAYKDAWSGKGDPEKFRAELARQGYDGVHIKGGEFGDDYYVAINPEQIKKILE